MDTPAAGPGAHAQATSRLHTTPCAQRFPAGEADGVVPAIPALIWQPRPPGDAQGKGPFTPFAPKRWPG
jgi:hypothetical protein